jgi:acetyltransferase-like isoleucine patch superfamily enzyme
MSKPIVIVGAGGLGKEIACLIKDLSEFELVGFYDDGLPTGQTILGKFPVLGSTQDLIDTKEELTVTIAFGNPSTRKKVWEKLQVNSNLSFPVLIHPQALLMNKERIALGQGTVVFPFSILTTDIKLGDNCLVHTRASVHHDVNVGSHSVIMPGARLVMSEQFDEATFVESNYFKPHSF